MGSMLSERLREAWRPALTASAAASLAASPAGERRGGNVADMASGARGLIESCVAGASLRLEDARALKGVGCGSMGPIWAPAEAPSSVLCGRSAAGPPAS